jgi:hypothetical protein
MREYTVIPTIGTFNISINEEHDDFYYMSVGGAGKQFRCVNISVPKKESNNTAIISYTESKDGCTIDGAKIKGDATRQMILLGITIARELSPHITHIDLDDMSHFYCKLPDEGVKKVPLHCFFFAFHGKTWYEEKFNAIIKNEELWRKYEIAKMNMTEPSKKPAAFYFLNDSLNKILQPIFTQSVTWRDFFDRIDIVYGKNKCVIVYPWLREVLSTYIFDNYLFIEGLKLTIAINDENTPMIRYYQVNKERGGGRNRKDYNDITSFFHTYNEQLSFHPDMLDWDYTTLLSRKHRLTQKKRREKNGK